MQSHSIAKTSSSLAGIAVLVTMFAPMVAIYYYGTALEVANHPGAGEVTVGIAVILRATARRLLRGASTNIMRTTAGALGRTSARAFTRRIVKFSGRLFFGSIVQQSAEGDEQVASSNPPQVVALAMGFAGLCLSFWGILHVAGEEVSARLRSEVLGTLEIVLLAGLPLLAYAGLHRVLGRRFGVRATYRTELDGLLLQGYFTGAGSFLPLTTDVAYEGTAEAKCRVATWAILGMFLLHVALTWIGRETGSPHLSFLGPMFLVYAFVYCFPIKPLDGQFIFATSKLQWLLVTVPILASFLFWLPPAFGEIL